MASLAADELSQSAIAAGVETTGQANSRHCLSRSASIDSHRCESELSCSAWLRL